MTSIDTFSVTFEESFPAFAREAQLEPSAPISFNDTRTVAILGFGRRVEVLVTAAIGGGADGEPQNFDPRLVPVGRFFQTTSYPVEASSFKLYRGVGSRVQVTAEEYLLDDKAGYIVLFAPLITGERLIADYLSLSDINFPRLFTREQTAELTTVYGSPSAENTIASAAQIAFANGAPRIICVQGDHTGSDPSWFNAYKALERTQVYMVVPMQSRFYSETVLAGLDHVQRMSDTPNRRERILIVGERPTIPGSERDSLPRSAAADFNTEERVLFVGADFPKSVIAGETVDANGGYLAAAVAGAWSSFEYVPTSLYKKELSRIVLQWPTDELYSAQELRQVANQGVTLLQKINGASTVGRFVMTLVNGNPVDTEPSIWRIRDFVAITMRIVLENRFVGLALIQQVLDEMSLLVEETLDGLISQKIITAYDNVRVATDSQEPRQVDVAFDIAPVFPLNDIVISIRLVSRF
jgi:hypothetical protein